MKSTEQKFTHVELGTFKEKAQEHSSSKQFLKDLLHLSGMEISVTNLARGTAVPFFHSHKQNEELYIVVEGTGQMQLDGEIIDVTEGSFVNVPPSCSRGIRASAESDLTYLCIQAKAGSLEQFTREDGIKHDNVGWQS